MPRFFGGRRRGGGGCKTADAAGRAPWRVYNPHSSPSTASAVGIIIDGDNTATEWLQVAAIDPALKNCAFRIERRRYPTGGAPVATPLSIETVLQEKHDFTNTENHDAGPYVEATRVIARLSGYLSACQYIVIESQMSFNHDMTRMGQHIISTLIFALRDAGVRPVIVEADPKLKSATFGAPRMKKPELKKWAAETAVKMLRADGETATADFIEGETKKDDHGDVVCYTKAWFQMLANGGAVHRHPPMHRRQAETVPPHPEA